MSEHMNSEAETPEAGSELGLGWPGLGAEWLGAPLMARQEDDGDWD